MADTLIPAILPDGTTVMVSRPEQSRRHTEEELYFWAGDEHNDTCAVHPKNIKANTAAYAKARKKNPRARKPVCVQAEECCPADLVVNAGGRPILVAAMAQVPWDTAKIMPGDRRRGPYYIELLNKHQAAGLMRLTALAPARRVELQQMRRLRTGDEVPEWVREAWSHLPKEKQAEIQETLGMVDDDDLAKAK